ncbi:MAG TPA: CocE/NonD family hydrolase [Arsenicitalea sp.]|jgi:dipeptidyl aminopeptidase/acylaminoacyl peptidase|nr:CocE/NonD family hydrolase [Arsenicitalea sp.]
MIKRITVGILALVVVLYIAGMGVMYFKQRDFEYDAPGKITALADTALNDAQTVTIPTTDGQTINGWYAAPRGGKPVILFYKGNSGSFSFEHARYEKWTGDGYGFLAFDYRGFPASPGTISQQHILDDALAAFDWLKAKDARIVVWGRSLGASPATYVATQRNVDALLLETPFDSAVSVANDSYWFFPVGLLMMDQFPSDQWIGKVKAPVFVAHGTDDKTIPLPHGEKLYSLVSNKHGMWVEPGGTHTNLWDRGIWNRAKAFFEDTEKKVVAAQ